MAYDLCRRKRVHQFLEALTAEPVCYCCLNTSIVACSAAHKFELESFDPTLSSGYVQTKAWLVLMNKGRQLTSCFRAFFKRCWVSGWANAGCLLAAPDHALGIEMRVL